MPPTARGGKYVPAKYVAPCGRREHRERPAQVRRERARGGEVAGVDLGMLLAVDLDRDQVLVEVRRDLGVAEALARHDVAPVAGRVADRDHHRHVAPLGLGERLLAPRPPVDRVAGVAAQVRAHRARQPVHVPSRFVIKSAYVRREERRSRDRPDLPRRPVRRPRVRRTPVPDRPDVRRAADLRGSGLDHPGQDPRPRAAAGRHRATSTSSSRRTTSIPTTSTPVVPSSP